MKKNTVLSLLVFIIITSCKKEEMPTTSNSDVPNTNNTELTKTLWLNPTTYLATLQFDGKDYFDTGEKNFPQPFIFNTTQDGNGDGVKNVEDNLENLVQYKIGGTVMGTGRTGLAGRGYNNQKPAVYLHIAYTGSYTVYEYWLYYADNDWLNDHEHDWEKYFVYVQGGIPKYIKISSHNSFDTYAWSSISKDNGRPFIKVDGGSHAMKFASEDGVKIGYTGYISKNNGTLLAGNSQTIPWIIYSNDIGVTGATSYPQSTSTFYYGDPYYLTNNNESGDPRQAPWLRPEWGAPPNP